MASIHHQQYQVSQVTSQYVVSRETNQRDNNEDSFLIYGLTPFLHLPPLIVLSLADGMGGHEHGEIVSEQALLRVSQALFELLCTHSAINALAPPSIKASDIINRLWEALALTNDYILRMVKANRWGKAGSTIAIAIIIENKAIISNIGDSAIFHYRQRTATLRKVSEEHTVTNALLRAGAISPAMASVHSDRHHLEFYIGAPSLPLRPPTQTVQLEPDDLLLLCTDGVYSELEEETIAWMLGQCDYDLQAMANQLIMAARERGETDNQTLILWRHHPCATVQFPTLGPLRPAITRPLANLSAPDQEPGEVTQPALLVDNASSETKQQIPVLKNKDPLVISENEITRGELEAQSESAQDEEC